MVADVPVSQMNTTEGERTERVSDAIAVGDFLRFKSPPFIHSSRISNKTKHNELQREREGLKMETQHALVVVFPVQGTFNALLDFAKILSSRGFIAKILSSRGFIATFVNTEHMHSRIFESRKDEEAAVESLKKQGLRIRFRCVPDGLLPEYDRASKIADVLRALQGWGPALERLASTVEEEEPPITCIVANFSVYSCTRHLAQRLGVPRVIFWPLCAAAAVAQCHTRLLVSNGHLPYRGDNALIMCLPPGVPRVLRSSDLTMSRLDEDLFQVLLYESDFYGETDCVVVNTFEELEGPEIMRGFPVKCPALTVGPVNLQQQAETRLIRTSMWKEDAECLGWLDGQAPGSVLYVSFGSIAVLSIRQLHELALGLEASQHPFLWVLRPEGKSLDVLLPRGFAERTRDRGMLVEWAPQQHVLAHGSVGGFLTHNGWNSTAESISAGVPMIGWPVLYDQFVNCRFATEVWKVGMSLDSITDGDGIVMKEEVENLVRGLMEGEEGEVLRQNAKRLREAAHKSVMPGGSSFTNIDTLVQFLNTNLRPRQAVSVK